MKQCVICKQDKEIINFCSDKSKKDGLSGRCKLCSKEYKEANKAKLWEKRKKYNSNNSEPILQYSKQYKKDHSEELKEIRILQKGEKRIYDREYIKRRKNIDPLFKLKKNISCRINESLRVNNYTKRSRTYIILGCTFEEFKTHIESLFKYWMNWNNYGNPKDGILEYNKTWDVDHIIPISSAKTEEELIKLNHFSNLQPLCSKVNRQEKFNKIL